MKLAVSQILIRYKLGEVILDSFCFDDEYLFEFCMDLSKSL